MGQDCVALIGRWSQYRGTLEWQSYIRGHHAYCMLWTPAVGKMLTLRREPENLFDCHAVAVIKNDLLVGHMPRSICRVVYYFYRMVTVLFAKSPETVYINRGVQLGLEVPCTFWLSSFTALIITNSYIHSRV